ncbi:hypothetical protein Acid345_3373 [Candidatus Koribacter versatilis Ellin345]|uniref:Helix-turn-helix domain-containing protein n=1 Tax=Koribacter versatilis (strain Ellin345) TaxID=204669 RepID=Q1IL76_KORVE|nr:hypothetical protein [Candidatus Koribacter versatilis]ABF42374.1 hypothetical protein Acid345_3373 [Candidatus Koribacter versatilis Ellin345]
MTINTKKKQEAPSGGGTNQLKMQFVHTGCISAPRAAKILFRSAKSVTRMCEAGELKGSFRYGERGWWYIPAESVMDKLNELQTEPPK